MKGLLILCWNVLLQSIDAKHNTEDIVHIKWYVLGPFPSGMNEIDGMPPFTAHQASELRLPLYPSKEDLEQKHYTEFKTNGFTKWDKVTEVNHGGKFVVDFTSVQWRELVQSLSSTELLQWQAWIVGKFLISKNDTEIGITCFGINTYWVDNGGPISADQYGNRPYSYYLKLNSGSHTITSLVRGKHQAQIQCNIKTILDKEDRCFAFIDRNRISDVVDHQLVNDVIGITIENRSPSDIISIITVSGVGNDKLFYTVKNDEPVWPIILPNQVFIIPVKIIFHPENNVCIQKNILPFKLRVKYYFKSNNEKISTDELPIHSIDVHGEFRCRFRGSSFQFTFIDADGSVQHAAAIHPIPESPTSTDHKFPVLLALHGTGVSASSSADSYKYKKKSTSEDYTFGIEGVWVLAPTRHGAHNWEGVGKNTAMAALRTLANITKNMEHPADEANVIFAGHSMGAHGAWILGYSFPDLALAVIPQAGWTTKETYGDSNTLFLHDIQSSSVDSKLKWIIEASVQENGCEFHVSNLKEIPCFARVGSSDQVVHPWWMRRMVRLLHNEKSKNIVYSEIPSKGHWWWDTKYENDGGVTNDDQMRKFFKMVRRQEFDENQIESEDSNAEFVITVYNPGSVSSKHGIQILQQIISFQKSFLKVYKSVKTRNSEVSFLLETANVRRIKINFNAILPSLERKSLNTFLIQIDDSNFPDLSVDRYNTGDVLEFCLVDENSVTWEICNNIGTYHLKQRSPLTYGPLRQVFERTFRIVYGTVGIENMKRQYREWALYLANTWYMTGDLTVEIHSDEKPIAVDKNILLIGDEQSNRWTKHLMDSNNDIIDFKLSKDNVQIGPCVFSGQVGFLSLFPMNRDSDTFLGAVIAGTTLQTMFDVIMLSKPTIPPMTRQPFSNTYPDFIVTGQDTHQKGVGGFLAAGFWGHDWKYDDKSSYVSYCKHQSQDVKDNNLSKSKFVNKDEL